MLKALTLAREKKELKSAAVAARRKNVNFEKVALDWFNSYAPDITEEHALKIRRYLENVFFPVIDEKSVTDLLPVNILEAVHGKQEKGRIQTTHRPNLQGRW